MVLKTYLENLKPDREYALWTILTYWRKSWNPALGTYWGPVLKRLSSQRFQNLDNVAFDWS